MGSWHHLNDDGWTWSYSHVTNWYELWVPLSKSRRSMVCQFTTDIEACLFGYDWMTDSLWHPILHHLDLSGYLFTGSHCYTTGNHEQPGRHFLWASASAVLWSLRSFGKEVLHPAASGRSKWTYPNKQNAIGDHRGFSEHGEHYCHFMGNMMINQQLGGCPIFRQTHKMPSNFINGPLWPSHIMQLCFTRYVQQPPANTPRKQKSLSCRVRRAVLCVKSPDSLSNASFSAAFLLLQSIKVESVTLAEVGLNFG